MAEEPFWPAEKNSSASSTSVRCRWRTSVASRSTDEATTARIGEVHGVPVARDHLRGDRLGREAHLVGDVGLDARIDVGEGADGARQRAGRHLLARRDQPLLGAVELGVGVSELQAEGDGLGVDAVAAADGRRHLVLERAALQGGEQGVDIGNEEVGGARQLHVEAGVEHVRGGHALVHEARLGPDDLGEVREEGDDVVLGLALDLIDARDVELGVASLSPDFLGGVVRDDAQLGHGRGRVRLDLEPDAETRFGVPDRRHLGTAVALDHRMASPEGNARSRSRCRAQPSIATLRVYAPGNTWSSQ